MHILQVCNVGNICGGTAACAWTITHALADHDHSLIFLTPPTEETVSAFDHCEIQTRSHVDEQLLRQFSPDVIILHNTPPQKVSGQLKFFSIQYHHSVGSRANATQHIACSDWLIMQVASVRKVLFQPIPIPPQPTHSASRGLSDELTIGRICTPSTRKWPRELLPFYEHLSQDFPAVNWEFIGVPAELKDALREACQHRCKFYDSGFRSREQLWNWDAMLYHHPTLTESFGRTVAESMRAGCLPIVDARGGFLEQITQGETGFHCSNLDEFANAIRTIQVWQCRRQMSQEAIAVSAEKFSLETFYNNFRRLLLEGSTLSVQSREN